MRIPKLNQYDVVEIKWLDAHGGGDEWRPPSPDLLKLEPITTVGQFFGKTDISVCVLLSRDSRNNVDAYITVPIVNIASIKKLA